ncbi:MAG: hypothetical protein IIB46_08905 [Nitrospinae bacterium]|nr:hypothetical protein [Nitrospinota bacterium]
MKRELRFGAIKVGGKPESVARREQARPQRRRKKARLKIRLTFLDWIFEAQGWEACATAHQGSKNKTGR